MGKVNDNLFPSTLFSTLHFLNISGKFIALLLASDSEELPWPILIT